MLDLRNYNNSTLLEMQQKEPTKHAFILTYLVHS